jgi:rfaE bifunctional protein kinase chain/domain
MKLHSDSLKAIKSIRSDIKGQSRIVFVSGIFNILHPGHLRLLRFAAECGDFLVVGILSDSIKNSFLAEQLRLEGVQSNGWVKHAFILRDQPSDFIRELKPEIVIKGKEHESAYNPEKEIVTAYGGNLIFGSGDISFSSVDILREEFKKFKISPIVLPKEFPERHGFNINDIKTIISEIKNLNICVLGDLIIDEYIECDPIGMSQEDPTIVVTPIYDEKFIGGAAIVAAHAAGLGATVHLFSIVGNDSVASFAREKLAEYKVNINLFQDESRPTTLKKRYRANEKTLLRVSHLRQHEIRQEIQNLILDKLISKLDGIDLLIFADFNYGALPQSLVNAVIDECNKRNILMVADSQCSSQIGDVSRFQGMSLLTPTEREARISVRDYESGLVVLAEKLKVQANCTNIVITLGAEGILIHANISEKNIWLTDRLAAFNTSPKDVSGAGDSLLTCTAMAMTLGNDIWNSVFFGSLAAASQVGNLGNIPITSSDLLSELEANYF